MKYLSAHLFTLVSLSGTSTAFIISPQLQSTPTISIVTLEATRSKRRLWKPVVSGGIMGWALATKIATASIAPPDLVHHIEYFSMREDYPTVILAQGAYQPESSFESLGMGMPSYSIKADERFDNKLRPVEEKEVTLAKQQGPGKQKQTGAKKDKAREKIEKEQADMKKYVERQQALASKKAEQEKQREKIAAERAAAKDAKDAERLAREEERS